MSAEVATCQNKLERSGVSFAFRAAPMPRREVARFKPINANQTAEDAAAPERPQKRQRRENYNSGGNRRGRHPGGAPYSLPLLLSPPASQHLSNGGVQTLDGNNAIQNRRTSCHQGDPPLHSSLESQSERQSNRQARRLDHAEYCSGSSQSSESQNLRTAAETLGDSAIRSARADCHPGDPPPRSSPEYQRPNGHASNQSEDQSHSARQHPDQLPDVTTSADINQDDTPFTSSFTMPQRPSGLQPGDGVGAAYSAALAKYLGTRSVIIPDHLSLQLFYLQRLLQSRLHAPVEAESPGAERRAGQLPGVTPLDTPAQLQAFASLENNPSLTGSVDSPTTVAAILELQLATGRDQRAGSQFQVDLQQIRISEPPPQSHPYEACSSGALLGINHTTQQGPRGMQPGYGTGAANLSMAGNGLESLNPGQHGEPASLPDKSPFELEMAQQLSLLSSAGDLSMGIGGFGANTLSAAESLSSTGTQTQLPDLSVEHLTSRAANMEGGCNTVDAAGDEDRETEEIAAVHAFMDELLNFDPEDEVG